MQGASEKGRKCEARGDLISEKEKGFSKKSKKARVKKQKTETD
jgi:hypothetical protein